MASRTFKQWQVLAEGAIMLKGDDALRDRVAAACLFGETIGDPGVCVWHSLHLVQGCRCRCFPCAKDWRREKSGPSPWARASA